MDDVKVLSTDPRARYVVVFDPLDGSSNIDVNISIGTISASSGARIAYTSRPKLTSSSRGESSPPPDTFSTARRRCSCSPRARPGACTASRTTRPSGSSSFPREHPNPGARHDLLHQRGPQRCLAGRYPAVECVAQRGRPSDRAPLQCTLRRAPSSPTPIAPSSRRHLRLSRRQKNPEGKLRLLYEANPFAFVFEAAGGKGDHRPERILDIVPTHSTSVCPWSLAPVGTWTLRAVRAQRALTQHAGKGR